MEIRSKEFAVRAEAADPTEEDLQLINERYALAPLTAEQVYVRRLALCNDQYDRTGERFPRFYLERFAETLPGKPLLAHHDKQQFPLGRFFHAQVVEVLSPKSPVQSEGDPGPQALDFGLETLDYSPASWLVCSAYLVKTAGNEEVRRQIDAGIYSHVSIGYRWADLQCDLCGRSYFRGECDHLIGHEYDGRRCTATYAGEAQNVEAVEGSLVYLGAQYGAVVTKSDDRRAEKAALGAAPPPDPARAELEGDGRLYRADLRREIVRLASCVGAEREGTALLQALGEVPAGRLKELLDDYQERFDHVFPPAVPAIELPERRVAPGFQFMP